VGFDCAVVAYRGSPVRDETLIRLIRERIPDIKVFRHAQNFLDAAPNLHCIALYDQPSGGDAALVFSEEELERTRNSVPADAPLSAIVQAAWKLARAKALETPVRDSTPAETERDRYVELARELSRLTRTACWAVSADHSCMGAFARYDEGQLVEQATDEGVYVDGEGYIDVPKQKLAAALAFSPLEVDQLFFRAFPDEGGPPMVVLNNGVELVPFDHDEFELALE
jgi:hypothetical protein